MKQQERKDHVTKLVKPGEERRSEPFCFGLWLGRGQVGFEGRPSMSICPAVRSCPDLRRGLPAGGGQERSLFPLTRSYSVFLLLLLTEP